MLGLTFIFWQMARTVLPLARIARMRPIFSSLGFAVML